MEWDDQVYLHMLASDNKLPRCGATHALCQPVPNEQQPTRIIKRFPQRAIKSPEQFNSIYTWSFTHKYRHTEQNFWFFKKVFFFNFYKKVQSF